MFALQTRFMAGELAALCSYTVTLYLGNSVTLDACNCVTL